MKSTKTLKRGITVFMALVALCIGAGAAQAQTYKGRFTLTAPVKWDQANLPAGQYTLTLTSSPSGQKFGIVRSESAHIAVMVMPQVGTQEESPAASELRIQGVGGESVVRSLYISDLGLVYNFPVPKNARKNIEQVANSAQRVKVNSSGN
jgi:hypothetical protein